MRLLPSLSLRGLGSWQYSVAHLVIAVTLASAFMSSAMSRSAIGVLVFGGAAGVGIAAAGWHYSNRPTVLIGASFALLAAAVLLAGFSLASVRGNAEPKLPITFEVCDAKTGLPITGAKVRIRDVALHNWGAGPPDSTIPAGETGAEDITDQEGQAEVAYRFSASTRETYFTFSACVFVNWQLYLTAAAPGYAPSTAPLHQYTGTHIENELDGSSLAHVQIFLEPDAKPMRGSTSLSRSAEGLTEPCLANEKGVSKQPD
jgi:hypothetical protein